MAEGPGFPTIDPDVVMEAFCALRTEDLTLNRKKRRTRLDLANVIFDDIEIFYNWQHRRSTTCRRVRVREPARSGLIWTMSGVTKLKTGQVNRSGGGRAGPNVELAVPSACGD
jgi:hypothetical protein